MFLIKSEKWWRVKLMKQRKLYKKNFWMATNQNFMRLVMQPDITSLNIEYLMKKV